MQELNNSAKYLGDGGKGSTKVEPPAHLEVPSLRHRWHLGPKSPKFTMPRNVPPIGLQPSFSEAHSLVKEWQKAILVTSKA